MKTKSRLPRFTSFLFILLIIPAGLIPSFPLTINHQIPNGGLPAGMALHDWEQINTLLTPSDNYIVTTYLKASNTGSADYFGRAVDISGDTVVVGADGEDSNALGVDGDQNNDLASNSGAAYVFVRNNGTWEQQAYLKASNLSGTFGNSVAISGDTIVVGAELEASLRGAAYVFIRSGETWSQQAYLIGSNTEGGDRFGAVDISGDTIVVGAYQEDSNARGVDGDGTNNSASHSGAAYVFFRSGETWSQQAYLKSSNSDASDVFGHSVAISGNTIVVGAASEDSIDPADQTNNGCGGSGAVYVFTRSGSTWSQQAYIKALVIGEFDHFGRPVAISGDTIIAGAIDEDSNAIGINGDPTNNSNSNAGAAYVFTRSGSTWIQQAYLKASNSESLDNFGESVAVDVDTIVIGAREEDGGAKGWNGIQNNLASGSGAAYIFTRSYDTWGQLAYVKATNTDPSDMFSESVSVEGDTVVVGAQFENSNATGVNGNQSDNSLADTGAAYLYKAITNPFYYYIPLIIK